MPDKPAPDSIREKTVQDALSQEDDTQAGASSVERDESLERLKQLQQDREERKKYADKIFRLIVIWLGFIMVLLFFQGFCNLLRTSPDSQPCFFLSDAVLIAAITSTTASVIALFVLVAKYLYPKRP